MPMFLMSTGSRSFIYLLSISLFLLLGACEIPFFPFERVPELPRGSITGHIVRSNGDAAPYARIIVQGAGKIVMADSEGAFYVSGLGSGRWSLRVTEDKSQNGIIDEALVRTFLIDEQLVVAETPLVKQDIIEQNTLYLGELQLKAASQVSGTVRIGGSLPSDVGSNVKVYAVRETNYFSDLTDENVQNFGFSFGAEAATHVDAAGNFKFNSLLIDNPERENAGGPLYGIAVQFAGNGATADEVVGMSQAVLLDADETPIFDIQVGTLPERGVLHVFNTDFIAADSNYSAYFVLQPPGNGAFPPCNLNAAPTLPLESYPAVKHIRTVDSLQDEVQIPLGVWDIRLCLSLNGQVFQGALREQVLYPALANDVAPLWGPYALIPADKVCHTRCLISEDDPTCEQSDLLPQGEGFRNFRDCDEDGIQGLPIQNSPQGDLIGTLRSMCEDECAQTLNAQDICSVTGLDAAVFGLNISPNGEYDCDDDGDTQPDVTEDSNCYGPGLGSDFDADGVCSGRDAYPECSANTADNCVAGINDLAYKN